MVKFVLVNRYRRGLETCPQAKSSKSVHAIFFSFSDASERRGWLSAESKILASTFGQFHVYRLTLILKHSWVNNNFFLNLSRMPYSSWHKLPSQSIFSRTRLEQNRWRRRSCSKQLEFHCQSDWLWLAFLWRVNYQWKLGRDGCPLCRRLDYRSKIKSWNSFTVWPWSKRTGT